MDSADTATTDDSSASPTSVERDFEMRIDAEGRWYHKGGLIKRIGLVKLFASVLSVDDAGQHWLRTPVEFGRISVEDAPFIITALASTGCNKERFITVTDNLDREFEMGKDTPLIFKLRTAEAASVNSCPYMRLPDGLLARLSRPVWYELAGLADCEDDAGLPGLWSSGTFFVLQPKKLCSSTL